MQGRHEMVVAWPVHLLYAWRMKQARITATSTTAIPLSGDRLQLMETFVRIVEAGNLSAAAERLHTTQPTVSRRLQALERLLGVRLLHRSTHVMRLTEDGARCFERAQELLANWSAFEADALGEQAEPEGLLRVAVPHAFGQEKFVLPLAAFLRAHPRVSVEWLLQDDMNDLIGAGIDCAIQVGEPSDPAVVAIKLAEVPRIVVAAPAVLQGGPPPHDTAGLAALPWLALRTYYRNELTLRHTDTGESQTFAIHPRVSTDSLYALRSAALLGLGACVGSAWLLSDDIQQGRLVHIAPQWLAAPLPVYLTYPYARYYPSRLQRFVAAMREAVPLAVGR
jgi:DNA-binding transcriptional LysR family regulator